MQPEALILLASDAGTSAFEAPILAKADAALLDFAGPAMPDLGGLASAKIGTAGRPGDIAAGAALFHPASRGTRRVAAMPPLSSPAMVERLAAAMALDVDGILLMGATGQADIEHLGAKLAVLEAECGRPAGSTAILASAADHAAGVLALAGLRPTPRLAGLLFDEAALAASLRCSPEATVLSQAAGATLLAASACGVPAFARLPRTGPDREADGDLQPVFAAIQHLLGEGFAGLLTDDPRLAAALLALRPSSDASARTSSPASRRSSRGSRPA